MDVTLILKIAGVGMLCGVACQILSKTGKDEGATYVSLAGIIVALIILLGEIKSLFELIYDIFGI